MSKTFKKVFLTEDDVLDPVTATVADMIREQLKAFNDMGFEAFAKYGYSREWILDPANRDRISIRCVYDRYVGDRYICMVDNCVLFSLTDKCKQKDDGTFAITYDVKYIYPFPEEVANNET
jgi:hypothetical protein